MRRLLKWLSISIIGTVVVLGGGIAAWLYWDHQRYEAALAAARQRIPLSDVEIVGLALEPPSKVDIISSYTLTGQIRNRSPMYQLTGVDLLIIINQCPGDIPGGDSLSLLYDKLVLETRGETETIDSITRVCYVQLKGRMLTPTPREADPDRPMLQACEIAEQARVSVNPIYGVPAGQLRDFHESVRFPTLNYPRNYWSAAVVESRGE